MASTSSIPLAVLLVEDLPDDAELLLHELRRGGFAPRARRVDNEAAFLAALADGFAPGQPWDIVVSDFQIPGFGGVRALELLQARAPDIPFILVSGAIGEEQAVTVMQSGAADYLVKGRLTRLPHAIRRALDANRLRLEARAAEQALRASEQRFRALIENSADGIGVVGLDGRLNYLSPAIHSILGFTPEQLLGRDPFDFVHPDDLALVKGVIRQVLATPGQSRETAYRLHHADGSWRTIRTRVTDLLTDPSVAGMVFNYRDITAQQADELALHASESRYRTLFESSPVALFEEDFSQVKQRVDGLLAAGHTDLAAYFAAHPEVVNECAGLIRLLDANATGLQLYRAASKTELVQRLRQVIVSEPDGSFRQELLNLAQGQTDFLLEGPFQLLTGERMHLSLRWSAVPGHEQTLARVMVSAMDITERVEAEQALRISEERYRGVFEGSPIALLEQDFSAVRQWLEALRQEGVTDWPAYFDAHPERVAECAALVRLVASNPSAQQLYAGDFQQIASSQVNSAFKEALIRIAQGQTRFELEAVQRAPSGPDRHITLRWSALPGSEQTLERVIVSAIDISERVQAEAELKRRLTELEAVNRVSVALRSAPSADEILGRLVGEAIAAVGGVAGSVWLLDETGAQVAIAHSQSWGLRSQARPAGTGIPGSVVATGQPVLVANLKTDPRVPEDVRAQLPSSRSGLCVPVRAAEQVIGALYIHIDQPRQFVASDVDLLTTLAEIAGSALHRARLHAQTEQQLSRMTALRSVEQAISSSLDLRVTLNVLLDQATTQLAVDAADVLLLNPHRQILEFAVGRGHRGGAAQRVRPRVGEGRAGRAAYERRLVHVADLREEAGGDPAAPLVAAEGYVAYYGVPLLAKGQIKGVLEIYHRQRLDVGQDWLDFLAALAGQAALAIDNAALFDGLQRSNLELNLAYDATLTGWARALDLSEEAGEGHSEGIAEMAVQLARALRLGEAETVHVRRGALLADIGNLGVPASVLLKPGPLTADEWALVRQHPVHAQTLLAPIQMLRPAVEIPYCHHERWDGSGYPRQLKGDAIPISARIFAVVDVWQALLADRPYRRAWPRERALAYLREQAGQQFDARVVEAFLRQIETEG